MTGLKQVGKELFTSRKEYHERVEYLKYLPISFLLYWTDTYKLNCVSLSFFVIKIKTELCSFPDKADYSANWLPEQMVYLDRQEHLFRMCKNYYNSVDDGYDLDAISNKKDLLEHVLVDSKHKLLYCYVPKVWIYIHTHVFSFKSVIVESVLDNICIYLNISW